ncbi:MAG: hypothetical protein DI536_32835 [Archangium gephyra]|uniref:Uncharacterized protein n=1 Tax=Archangium gephyra TaxID=48 RepID=A0A2W5T017_9BACT|nr:MAG: hypothetical protein DI536_32835 [Archangium gephyra]
MERTQQAVADGNTDVVPSLAHVEVGEVPLARWLDAALTGESLEARDGAVQLLVAGLATLPPTQANADVLVQLLEGPALDGVHTRQGDSVKELAVEALLRLGYPHALRIHPDALEWARARQRQRTRSRWTRAVALALGLVNLGLWGALWWNGSLRFFSAITG